MKTLARRAFMDIDLKIQLQMARDSFIDGQAECALRRHLDSLGPNTPMTDIVDCCRMWERHCEVEIQPRTGCCQRQHHRLRRRSRDLLIQQLMEAICPPTPVVQERSPATDLEKLLLNWLEQSRRRTLLCRTRHQIPSRGAFRAGV